MKTIFFVIPLVLCVGLLFGAGCVYVTPANPVEDLPSTPVSASKNITITTPKSGADISNPLHIEGTARVFEAVIQWRVLNAMSEVVATGHAMAAAPDVGEFGDYAIDVPFTTDWETGTYRVEVFSYSAKDGSEQDVASIPVYLRVQPTQTLNIFYVPASSSDCLATERVERHIYKTVSPARVAALLLLNGPTEEEKAAGIISSIPEGTTLHSIVLSPSGELTVDLGGAISYGLGGSCLVGSIRSQMESTMKQFDTITSVKVLIDGQENRLEP